ncbi:MAG TPA: carboxypeptidase-like regulatory domain-containing protein [Terriglobia bacterium]|nr:carboxypeptidase-like regulatory domain-containing protein [Terriglobia bacterium]
MRQSTSPTFGVRSFGPLTVWIVLAALPGWPQVSASISGTVTDPSGAALPGTAIMATSLELGTLRRTVTDESGQYELLSLPVGQYQVRAEKRGFKTEVRARVDLAVGQEVIVDFALPLGEVKQRVRVTGQVPVVSTTTEQTSGLVGEREVKELPLNGRSYDELVTLNPGVVNYTWEKTGGIGISNSAVGNMFAASGRRPQENLFLLNGVEFTGAAEINMQPGGTSGQLLGVEAVREFNVLKDTYGAEYGKRPGAQVTIVTESGTNQLHGTAFEYLRHSGLDARNFFDRGSKPGFQRDQFGGALGGPIAKDKTFAFGNYEGFRQRLGLSAVTLVPDNNARNGLLPNPDGTLSNVGVAPGVGSLLALWPVPNGPRLGGGIAEAFSHPLQSIREDFGTTRVDHTFSEKDSLASVYTIDDGADVTPTSNPLSLDLESLREQVLSLDETHVISPTTVNTARFGFSRASYFYTGEPALNVPGFVAGHPVGAVVIGGSASPNSASQISLAGSNVGSNLRIARNLFTYEDRISAVRGRHRISFGAWFQRIQSNENLALTQWGQATFSSLTNFLQGKVTTFLAAPSPTPLGWRSLEGAAYLEDAIRLRRSFTLSLGLRDEFTNGWNEAFGRAANFVFDTRGVIVTQPRVAHSVFTVNKAKFLPQPRVALAWSPLGQNAGTVIRAGFGLYNYLQDGLGYRLDQDAPFNTTFAIRNASVSGLKITPGGPLPAGAKVTPAGVQPNLLTPTIESYTFSIEQRLSPNTALRVGYVGSHAYHEIVSIDANEPFPIVCPTNPCPASLPTGTIFYPKGAPLANPALANSWSWFSEGTSSYNALQIDVNRRWSAGVALRGVYTWSKSLDNGDTLNGSAAANAPGLVMNPANLRSDWGPSTFDVRNAVTINGTYDLPFGKGKSFLRGLSGWRDFVASGWTLDGIETLQAGFPFTPQLSFNPSNNGDTRNPVRPSWNASFHGPVILGGPDRFFDPRAFVAPPDGTYGNVGRDTFVGPGLATLDLSLLKNSRITERLRLQFRAEFFNVLNRANFNTPNLIVFTSAAGIPSNAAGVITSTSTTSRQIQFALKLLF